MKDLKKSFEEATNENLQSGCLKFSSDYVSKAQLYAAATDWVQSDERVKLASIRGGGGGSHALDFRYDVSGLDKDMQKGASLEKIFKKFFKEKLGDDYIKGWDYSIPTVMIK